MAALHPTIKLSDPVGHLREFITGILEQTDLDRERANYEKFRELFASSEDVHFPHVIGELSSTRVMTMDFLRGHKLDALPGGDHKVVAKQLQRIFLKMVFEDGFVHADLHPGNLLLLDDGKIAIFDVGLVKHLGDDVLLQCVDFTKCLVMGTAKDFADHMKRFHHYNENVDWVAFEKDIEGFIVKFRSQKQHELEMGDLLNEILGLGRRYGVRPISEMALVMVAMVTAEGIGKQLDPHTNLFEDTAAFLLPVLARRGLTLTAA